MTSVMVYMKVDHFRGTSKLSPSALLPVKNNPSLPRSRAILLGLVQGMFPDQPTSPKNQIQHRIEGEWGV